MRLNKFSIYTMIRRVLKIIIQRNYSLYLYVQIRILYIFCFIRSRIDVEIKKIGYRYVHWLTLLIVYIHLKPD